jgi:plastocyanin
MKTLNSGPAACVGVLVLAGMFAPQPVHGTTWLAVAGAESDDLGRQAWAFLPNELWIHAGDSVTWTFASQEPHTVSFLTESTLRPTIPNDDLYFQPTGSSFDGSSNVNSGEMTLGQTYTVKFPTSGNYKLACLAHLYMNGAIHVLPASTLLPHNQAFYDRTAAGQRERLLSDIERRGEDLDQRGDTDGDGSPTHRVIAGLGEIVAAGLGVQTAAAVRFFPQTITVHVGQTVEWTNKDPMTGHSITFGVDPATLGLPERFPIPIVSSGVGVSQNLDPDGALHATVSFPTDNVHSGNVQPLPADKAIAGPNAGLPLNDPPVLSQFPLPTLVKDLNPRFRVTFTHTGTFNYYCVFHDNLGMLGQVTVLP